VSAELANYLSYFLDKPRNVNVGGTRSRARRIKTVQTAVRFGDGRNFVERRMNLGESRNEFRVSLLYINRRHTHLLGDGNSFLKLFRRAVPIRALPTLHTYPAGGRGKRPSLAHLRNHFQIQIGGQHFVFVARGLRKNLAARITEIAGAVEFPIFQGASVPTRLIAAIKYRSRRRAQVVPTSTNTRLNPLRLRMD